MEALSPPTTVSTTSALEAVDLVVEYGHRRRVRAVDRVSIQVARGEAVGVVGESGSGKSSLALAVAGLRPVSAGSLRISGVDRVRRTRSERADVQLVFQDPTGSLDPRQSIGDAIKELMRVHPQRTCWIDAAGLVDRVGLTPEILTRYPHQISGGQAQRICIALGLLLRPSVLVADEPTSALDVRVQAQIIDLLKTLREQEGLTILFVSHDLAVVRALCDRVYVMFQGQIVESGTAREVIDHPQHAYTQRLIAALPGRHRLASTPRASE